LGTVTDTGYTAYDRPLEVVPVVLGVLLATVPLQAVAPPALIESAVFGAFVDQSPRVTRSIVRIAASWLGSWGT
jgi:hypothetical protein